MTEKEVLTIVKKALREERKAIVTDLLEALSKNNEQNEQKAEPMSVQQAAKYADVTVSVIRYWLFDGKLPRYKTGEGKKCRVYINKKDMDNFLLGHCIQSNAQIKEQAENLAKNWGYK